jgi:hypothetical protein
MALSVPRTMALSLSGRVWMRSVLPSIPRTPRISSCRAAWITAESPSATTAAGSAL